MRQRKRSHLNHRNQRHQNKRYLLARRGKFMGKCDGISAEQVQDRSWKFEEFQDYFQQEGKKWGNSSPFKAVVSAVKSYSKLRQKEITPESAIKLVNTNDALLKACAEYKSFKENEEKNLDL